MKSKALMLSLIAVLLFCGISSSAHAVCAVEGKVEMVYANATTGNPWVYFYVNPLRSSPLSSYYYYFRVEQNTFAAATTVDVLSDAFADSHTVYIVGNASSCPTSGTTRYGGVVSYTNVYRIK